MRKLGHVEFNVVIELPDDEDTAEIAFDAFCDDVEQAITTGSASSGDSPPFSVIKDGFAIVEAWTEIPDPEREGLR